MTLFELLKSGCKLQIKTTRITDHSVRGSILSACNGQFDFIVTRTSPDNMEKLGSIIDKVNEIVFSEETHESLEKIGKLCDVFHENREELFKELFKTGYGILITKGQKALLNYIENVSKVEIFPKIDKTNGR